jgi:putative transposase
MDFLSEVIIETTQQWVRIINIVDECSRKDLWVEACEHIKATKLTEILDKLVFIRGRPAYIRTDNGPEFISDELAKWATKNEIELRFIQPGKPTQNGIIERLNAGPPVRHA